ncbi:MAG: hypothetical protein IJY20_05605 [Clostridia bacterium]|nr:hypothetical protein [Clostridia bacterium]
MRRFWLFFGKKGRKKGLLGGVREQIAPFVGLPAAFLFGFFTENRDKLGRRVMNAIVLNYRFSNKMLIL